MKVNKKDLITIIFIIFFCLFENIFYLVDTTKIRIGGMYIYDNLCQMLFIITMFLISAKIKTRYPNSIFKYDVIALIVLSFISSITAYIYVAQPIKEGLLQQSSFILILLAYFPIRKIILSENFNYDLFKRNFIKIGYITIILALLHIIFGNYFTIIHVQEAVDVIRLYLDSFACVVIAFFGMDDWLKNRKLSSLLPVVMAYIYELFIGKGRLEFGALTIAIVVAFIFKDKDWRKSLKSIILVVIAAILFFNSSYSSRFHEAIENFSSEDHGVNSMGVRLDARVLFKEQLTENPATLIFGCGYPSSNWEASAKKIKKDHHYGLVDNGIYGFVYVYGILGLFVLAKLFLKIYKLSIAVMRKEKCFLYLMFIIFITILLYNIVFWWYKPAWTLGLVLFMTLLEKKYIDWSRKSYGEDI